MIKTSSNITLGYLAAKNYQNIDVFKRMGIDFWCLGFKTLEEAAADIGVSIDAVNTALAEVPMHKNKIIEDFNSWDVELLIDHIISEHHEYAKKNLIIIYELTRKVIYRNQKTR